MDCPRAYPRRNSPGSRASAGDLFPRAFAPAAVVCSFCDSTKRSASTAAACCIFSQKNCIRRSGRVVEGDGLENRSASKGRQGFESLLLLDLRWEPWEGSHTLRPPTCHTRPARCARPRAMVRGEQSSPAPHATRPSHLRSGRNSVSTKHPRRGGREAEGGGLLNRYTGENLYREFESHPLRQNEALDG